MAVGFTFILILRHSIVKCSMNVYDGIRNILKTLRLKEFLLGNKQKVPKNDEHFSANETRRFSVNRVIMHKGFLHNTIRDRQIFV